MEEKEKLVSIVMPAYRDGELLRQSVASVRAQTWKNWELLLVDDCSPDDTWDVARALAEEDDRIRLFRTETSSGPAAARNIALENARGKYVAFLDSDDLWKPEKLARQIAFMERTGAAFSCTAYDRISEDGSRILGRVVPFAKADYDKVLYTANPVGNSTAVYDREVLGELRVPLIRKRNDFALWLAALKKTDFVYGLGDCLGAYRVRKNSVSSRKTQLIRYQWQLYRNVEGLSLPKTLLAFAGLFWVMLFRPTWRRVPSGEETAE